MSRIIHLGAELGHVHAEGLTVNGAGSTYDTTVVRSGARSYKFDASATQSLFYNFTGAVSRRVWTTLWFRIPAATGLPSIAARLLAMQTGAGGTLCGVQLRVDGKIRLVDQANALIGSDSAATVQMDTWHRLDLAVEIETGATDFAELRLDGVMVASTSTGAFSDVAPGRVHFGWFDDPGTSEVVYIDDIVINDEQGAVNNTWPGDERVYALLPTADAARDAGWLNGGGVTTNLFNAVDNIPPTGTTTAGNGTQIKNAVSTTTEEYDATMQTYTAAGVGATDIVTAIYGVWEAGSSSTTGSDTIGGEVESNPAIAEVLSTVDSVVGVYPTGWNRGQTTIAENPTVTLGTAPVMSVRKNVAATRIHQVCLMAIVVSAKPFTGAPDQTRTAPQDAAISTPGLTRTADQTASISTPTTSTRTAAQTAAILVTNVRSAGQSAAISVANQTRQASQSAAISVAGNQRVAPQSAAIRITGSRTAPQTASIQTNALTRQAAQSAAIAVLGATRSAVQTASIQVTSTRAAAQSAAISTAGLQRTAAQTASISVPGPGTVELFAPQSAAISTPNQERLAPQSAAILVQGVRVAGQSAAISTPGLSRQAVQSAAIAELGQVRQAPQTASIIFTLTREAPQTAAISTLRLVRTAPQTASISVEGPSTPTFDHAMQAPARPGTLSPAAGPAVGQVGRSRTLKAR